MRKVEDIKEKTIQTTARMADTYSRPAVADEGRVEKLAAAWLPFNAKLSKFLDNKQKEKDNFEVAQGVAFVDELRAKGYDIDDETVKEYLKSGNTAAFKTMTQKRWEGVHIAQHQSAGARLQAHMKQWQDTYTMDDGTGKMVPISEIKDQTAVITAFEQEKARWLMQETGGKYDPVLAREYIDTAARQAEQEFIGVQGKKRAEQWVFEQERNAKGLLDGKIMPILTDGTMKTNPALAISNIKMTLDETLNTIRSWGTVENDAARMVKEYVVAAIASAPDVDTLEKLKTAAGQVASLQTPEIIATFEKAAEQGRNNLYFKHKQEQEYKQDEAEDAAFDLISRMFNGDLTPQEKDMFVGKSRENLAAYNRINAQYQTMLENSNPMDAYSYQQIQLKAMRGEMNSEEFSLFISMMSYTQAKELYSLYRSAESEKRSIRSEQRSEQSHALSLRSHADQLIEKENAAYDKIFEKALKDNSLLPKLTSEGTLKAGMVVQRLTCMARALAKTMPQTTTDTDLNRLTVADALFKQLGEFGLNAIINEYNTPTESASELQKEGAKATFNAIMSPTKTSGRAPISEAVKKKLYPYLEQGDVKAVQRLLRDKDGSVAQQLCAAYEVINK
ncbi:hypothetical protein [Cloacibacillus porcorum]